MIIRQYTPGDEEQMIAVWNEVVKDGAAFPQEELLDSESGKAFFSSQTYCGVAETDDGIAGLYILHPNYIGRCGHIANASYAVASSQRGKHIGEALVLDSLQQAKRAGFLIMQFNAVVESNLSARHLYERIGFTPRGIIPNGFRRKDGQFENICPYILELKNR